MATVDDIQAYLASQGFVDGDTGWTSVRRRVHDGSDKLVILTEDGGPAPELDRLDDSAALITEGVQIRVRGGAWDGDSVAEKMAAIYDALHGLTDTLLGERRYLGIAAASSSPAAFEDENGRWNMTMSFLLTRSADEAAA